MNGDFTWLSDSLCVCYQPAALQIVWTLNCWSVSSSWCWPLVLPTSCSWAPLTDLTMPLVVDAVWAVWSIAAGVYDYFHTSAMEERIHTLEQVLSIHQFVIAGLSAGLVLLMTYILWRKHWWDSPWIVPDYMKEFSFRVCPPQPPLRPSECPTWRRKNWGGQQTPNVSRPDWQLICSVVISLCSGCLTVKQEIRSLCFTIVAVCVKTSVTSRTRLLPQNYFLAFFWFYSCFYAITVSVPNVHLTVYIIFATSF